MKTATRLYLILAILLSTTICQACQGQYRAEDDTVTEKIYFAIGIIFVIACSVAICRAIPSLENFHQGPLVSIVLIIYYLPQFLLYELLLLGWDYYRKFTDNREDPKEETEREDSNPTETWKQATVEAEVENGTTIPPEKITNGKTTLKAKSNVSGDVAEAGKQRVREVFHMDVAELIIERDA